MSEVKRIAVGARLTGDERQRTFARNVARVAGSCRLLCKPFRSCLESGAVGARLAGEFATHVALAQMAGSFSEVAVIRKWASG